MPQSGRDPVVRKNHIEVRGSCPKNYIVSLCDISRLRDPTFLISCCGVGLPSLDLKFKVQEGAGLSPYVVNDIL